MRVFDIKGSGRRMEDRSRGHVYKLNSISYLRSYYFLVTITLSSRWARGGGGGWGGVTKRLREKGYYNKDILDLTGKRLRGVLLTKGDSKGLEITTLMDTGHC